MKGRMNGFQDCLNSSTVETSLQTAIYFTGRSKSYELGGPKSLFHALLTGGKRSRGYRWSHGSSIFNRLPASRESITCTKCNNASCAWKINSCDQWSYLIGLLGKRSSMLQCQWSWCLCIFKLWVFLLWEFKLEVAFAPLLSQVARSDFIVVTIGIYLCLTFNLSSSYLQFELQLFNELLWTFFLNRSFRFTCFVWPKQK